MNAVVFSDVYKSYTSAADSGGVFGVSLDVPNGRFTTLVGASGSGKTTLLRLLAGFLRPSSGEILIHGQKVAGNGTFVPPHRRDLAMVFQSYALWPHMTVFDNVAFGLRARKTSAAEIPERVGQALELVGLSRHGDRQPGELSGGQQQRVALARSLVLRPRLLLLDEPLSNLDADLRLQMRNQLKELQTATGITFIYVTHDQDEAYALSDYLVVLEAGRLLQAGSPQDLYFRPADVRVARFLNRGSLVLEGAAEVVGGGVRFRPDDAHGTPLEIRGAAAPPGAKYLLVRAEALQLALPGEPMAAGWLSLVGRAATVAFLGRENQIRVDLAAGVSATLYDSERRTIAVGQPVRVAFQQQDVHFMAA